MPETLCHHKKGRVNIYYYVTIRGITRELSTFTTDLERANLIASHAKIAAGNENTAEKAIASLRDALNCASNSDLAVDNLWDLYTSTDPRLEDAELNRRYYRIRKLKQWLNKEGITNINMITPKLAHRYMQTLKKGRKGKTYNIYLQNYRHIFKRILLETDLSGNPFAPVVPMRTTDSRTGRSWRAGETDLIYAACKKIGQEWYQISKHAEYSGFRYKDLCMLKWDYVGADIIESTPAKTAKHNIHVWSPIHSEVREILQTQQGKDKVWVYPERHRAYNPDKTSGYNQILSSIGIKSDNKHVVSFHCHRHEFASKLAKAGVPQSVRMRLGGWTTSETENIYNHDLLQLVKAINAIDKNHAIDFETTEWKDYMSQLPTSHHHNQ